MIDLKRKLYDQARDGTLTVIEAAEYALGAALQDARDGGMCLACGALWHYGQGVAGFIDHMPECRIEILDLAVRRAKERGEV